MTPVMDADELREQAAELRQKLEMAERAVDDKDGGLRDVRKALELARADAEADLRQLKEDAEQELRRRQLELEHEELQQKEARSELVRLQEMEALRRTFDREREFLS